MAAKIKKGDSVVVLTGKDKGRKGTVTKVMPTEDRVLVQGVNMVQRHTRPSQSNPNGVGGIQAAAIAVIASGTVSSISIVNPGAGYPTAPVAVVVPSPFDPNLATGITNATVAFSLTSVGAIMGAIVTNNGSPLPNGSLGSVTLSIGGAGSSGSLTANVMQTFPDLPSWR